jgi:hypothetical protein
MCNEQLSENNSKSEYQNMQGYECCRYTPSYEYYCLRILSVKIHLLYPKIKALHVRQTPFTVLNF